jgi:hypothetical protein
MAVTRPLAGISVSIRPFFQTCLVGSRLDTTRSGDSPSRSRANCFRRSSVHKVSPMRRSVASSSAAARARYRLLASTVTSRAIGPNNSESSSSGGCMACPRLSARVHRAILAIGRVMLNRTSSQAMSDRTAPSTTRRIAL